MTRMADVERRNLEGVWEPGCEDGRTVGGLGRVAAAWGMGGADDHVCTGGVISGKRHWCGSEGTAWCRVTVWFGGPGCWKTAVGSVPANPPVVYPCRPVC